MAVKEDGENASQEGDQRIMDLALQAVYKGIGKGKWASARVGMRRVRMEERTLGIKAVARMKAKGKSKAARERPESVGRAARQDTLQPGAGKEETKTCTPEMKMAVRTPKSQSRMKRICRRGVNWKRVKMSSGRKSIKRHC